MKTAKNKINNKVNIFLFIFLVPLLTIFATISYISLDKHFYLNKKITENISKYLSNNKIGIPQVLAAPGENWFIERDTSDDELKFYYGVGNMSNSALTIASDGKVGIGTANQTRKLHVIDTISTLYSAGGNTNSNVDGSVIYINNNSTTDGTFAGVDTAVRNTAGSAYQTGYMGFVSNATGASPSFVLGQRTMSGTVERLRIDANGNVGIGTTVPGANLEVVGSQTAAFLLRTTSPTSLSYPSIGVQHYRSTGGGHPVLSLSNSNGSYSSPTNLGSSTVGAFVYQAYDGTDVRQVARIDARTDLGFGSTDYGSSLLFFTANGALQAYQTPVRMAITSEGNVGIGTISPEAKLHINEGDVKIAKTASNTLDMYTTSNGSSGNFVRGWRSTGTLTSPAAINASGANLLLLDGNGYGTTGFSPNAGRIAIRSAGAFTNSSYPTEIYFSTTPASSTTLIQRMIINSDGYVGIGTSTPSEVFHSYSSSNTAGKFESVQAAAQITIRSAYAAANEKVKFIRSELGGLDFGRYTDDENTSTPQMFIANSGNVGIGTTNPGTYKLNVQGDAYATGTWGSSDQRLKKNFENLNNVMGKLNDIHGVKFDWRTEEFPDKALSKERQIGLVAQEVEKQYPELVKTDNQGYKAVSYERFTAVLLEALKEQQKEINSLKQEIEVLKTR